MVRCENNKNKKLSEVIDVEKISISDPILSLVAALLSYNCIAIWEGYNSNVKR